MSIVMATFNSEITQSTDYDYLAEFGYGENGNMYGPGEITLESPWNTSSDYITWDTDPSDGVDATDYVYLSLKAGSTGLTFKTDAVEGLSDEVATFSGIDHIDIRTAVQGQCAMEWSGVSILFLNNGVVGEEISLGGFGVNKLNVEGGAVAEEIVSITPTHSTYDQVVISGSVHLSAAEGYYPGVKDIFSQVLIYTA